MGLRDIKQAERLRLRPYIVGGVEKLDAVAAPDGTSWLRDVGIDDLKFALTPNLIADLHFHVMGLAVRAFTSGVSGAGWAKQLGAEWRDDRLEAGINYLKVDPEFVSGLGFVRRHDRMLGSRVSFRPRPGGTKVRQFELTPTAVFYHNDGGDSGALQLHLPHHRQRVRGVQRDAVYGRRVRRPVQPLARAEGDLFGAPVGGAPLAASANISRHSTAGRPVSPKRVSPMRRGGRLRVALGAALLLAAGCGGTMPFAPSGPGPVRTHVLVGAGDIAVCGSEATEETKELLDEIDGTVFTAGDNAYPSGTAEQFRRCYDPTWGRHKARTRPAPGNHDYEQPGAGPYFDYFGSNAGPRGLGYYSYEIGPWHVVALNSNIPIGVGSPQYEWVRADLRDSTATCTAAYWHHPRFSSGLNGSDRRFDALWRLLYELGVDVVINGHDHSYERFAPQNPDGRSDPVRGIRQFVVGTGGAVLYPFPTSLPNSEVRHSGWGVLKLTLQPDSYAWEFVPIRNQGFRDLGGDICH